jgi:hypothetical protein
MDRISRYLVLWIQVAENTLFEKRVAIFFTQPESEENSRLLANIYELSVLVRRAKELLKNWQEKENGYECYCQYTHSISAVWN